MANRTLKYGILWLRYRPASGRGSVKVSGKKFLPLKFQLKEKSFCQEPEGLDLDCAGGGSYLCLSQSFTRFLAPVVRVLTELPSIAR